MSVRKTASHWVAPERSRFDRDTALEALGEGRYRAHVDRGWWIVAGPNGGFLAALLLHALQIELDEPERTPRSLHIHYATPPAEGDLEIATRIERTGRSASTLTARMTQGDRLCALATATFSKPRSAQEFCDLRLPETPAPEDCEPPAPRATANPSLRDRYETRIAHGVRMFEGGGDSATGGWIRLVEGRPIDHMLVAALTDAWPPALFSRHAPGEGFRGVPTIDLTVHFRTDPAALDLAPDDWCYTHFWTRMLQDGFMEEDGEVWSRSGQLLAQCRQLAAVL